MKTITFRPLRIIKKTGKITVASYMQWRRIKTANYSKFNLVIKNEYADMPLDEFVFNSDGEQLFFFTYDPNNVPVFDWHENFDLESIRKYNSEYGINWDPVTSTNYSMRGTDCDGVPTFSHYTAKRVADNYHLTGDERWSIEQFEPLTVSEVLKWLSWFLYQLEKSCLKVSK